MQKLDKERRTRKVGTSLGRRIPPPFVMPPLRTVDIRLPFPAMNVKMLKVNNTLIVSEDALGSNLVA